MSRKARRAKKLKKKALAKKPKRPIKKWIKKKKAKKWVKIHAPKIFNEVVIGETLTSDPQKAIGRTIDAKLSSLLRDMSKSQISLRLRINKIKNDEAFTDIIKYVISRMVLSRIIRRRSSKIEAVEDLKIDDKLVRLKFIAITLKKATSLQKKSLKNKLSYLINQICSEYKFGALILAVISGKIQKDIIIKLKKVYPLRKIEVRMIEVITEKKTTGEHKHLKKEEPEPELPKEEKIEEKPVEEKEEPKEEKVKQEKPKEELKKEEKKEESHKA